MLSVRLYWGLSWEVEFSIIQALRAQRASQQQSKKKRKRTDGDEDASTADEMSDSDDAVGARPFHASCVASSHEAIAYA